MKQLLTIFLLLLVIALQYSRQLAFIQCKIAAVLKSSAFKCDCENDDDSIKKMQQASLPLNKFHYIPDDFYCSANISSIELYERIIIKKWSRINVSVPKNRSSLVFHPPCC